VVGAKNCALVAALLSLVTAVPAALATPAAAAPTSPSVPAITHPQDDWAGSQIAAHEGTGSQSMSLAVPATAAAQPAGLDVSSHQGNVTWSTVRGNGAAFAYVKATEGTDYVNPNFGQQYNGAYSVGVIRGAYHFATPNTSNGKVQADYFVAHGGGWSADGKTLPPAVDLEYNPYGQQCYSMKPAALVTWVRAFVNEMHARTKRWPTIYTSTSWWSLCMANNASFGADPLWIARYNTVIGALPAGWNTRAIWQYADSGKFPGDQDTYNGTLAGLRALAKG
jgi:GH25 family lysozyme M1 (1,4-beta-N-acetylmuramidase)